MLIFSDRGQSPPRQPYKLARGPSPPRQPYKLGQDIFYHQFDVELPHSNCVTCVVMMDDGRIVFSIFYFNRLYTSTDPMLLIYNIDGSHEDSIPLQCISHGITAIDNSTVAVTSYATIDMYDINNKVKLKSIVLHVPGIYFHLRLSRMINITTINNNIVVGIHNSKVIIRQMR